MKAGAEMRVLPLPDGWFLGISLDGDKLAFDAVRIGVLGMQVQPLPRARAEALIEDGS